ncbi:MAG: AraC family transcriptional regulator [Usitatibacter sp.]
MTTQDLRLEAALDEMTALITRFTAAGEGTHATPISGLVLHRRSAPQLTCIHGVHNPCIAVIAQGAKRMTLGEEVYLYDRANYLVGSIDLPVTGQVVQASAEKPYLSFKIDVDPREIASLLLEAPPAMSEEAPPSRGLYLTRTGLELTDAFVRLLRLIDTPEDIAALEGGIRREIMYRVLKSGQGHKLRQIATGSGQSRRIARTVEWLRRNFAQPLRVEDLAALANMSPSAFHEHFRAMTAMSPLQFQKQLRLQEARQMLMSEDLDAATAGHRVGYESPSQFSREYSRLFGVPPATDMKRLRSTPQAGVAA